ncbi:sensor histidine kinase [Paenibacillaceae bacterium]|nr:sensor histidine kinase [Paenibacillaceae bacterium]
MLHYSYFLFNLLARGRLEMTFFNNSLRNKLILFLLGAIIIPISVSIVVTYVFTKESVTKTNINNNTTLLYQGSSNIENYLNNVNQASLLIYQDAGNERSLFKITGKDTISFSDERELAIQFQFIANSLAEINQIYMYMDHSQYSYRFYNNLLRKTAGKTYTPKFENEQDVSIESTHQSHNYNLAKFPFEIPEQVFTVHRKILNHPSDTTLGTISMDVKLNMIKNISDKLYISGSEQFYLFNQDGTVIYASNDVDPLDSQRWLQAIKQQSGTAGYMEYKDEQFAGIQLYETIKTPIAEWVLVKHVPFEQLSKDARQLTMINSLIVLLFLIIAVIATIYISFHFTSPIKQLIRYINKIESGQLDASMDTQRTDEIGMLSKRFHQLMQRLDQLINREYKLELANKTNQLKALQAQVQPHFMNNALQSIGTLALQNKEKKIYLLIAALGKMMRYQMNTSEALVPLSSEIDYVNAYLNLQAQRFGEYLTFQIEQEEEAKSIRVPKMIVQPLVENCFKHGIITENNVCHIAISASVSKQQLVVSIADNGPGMEKSGLEALQFQLDHLHSEGSGSAASRIGLFNVLSRLRLYFNPAASILVESVQPRGFKVTLLIPLEEGGGLHHESTYRR